MRDVTLISLLNKMNRNPENDFYYLRPLSDNVIWAKIWLEKPKPSDEISSMVSPDKFYFIKNTDGVFVAIVYDMTSDLHWFVLPKYRKKGLLTKALKEIILFHLFQDRDKQRITIDINLIGKKNFKASESVALKLGFEKISDVNKTKSIFVKSEYFLSVDEFQTDIYFGGKNTLVSETRMKEITRQINFISRSLWLIHTEVEMKFGKTDYSEDLEELIKEVKDHTWKFEDHWWEAKKNLNQ